MSDPTLSPGRTGAVPAGRVAGQIERYSGQTVDESPAVSRVSFHADLERAAESLTPSSFLVPVTVAQLFDSLPVTTFEVTLRVLLVSKLLAVPLAQS